MIGGKYGVRSLDQSEIVTTPKQSSFLRFHWTLLWPRKILGIEPERVKKGCFCFLLQLFPEQRRDPRSSYSVRVKSDGQFTRLLIGWDVVANKRQDLLSLNTLAKRSNNVAVARWCFWVSSDTFHLPQHCYHDGINQHRFHDGIYQHCSHNGIKWHFICPDIVSMVALRNIVVQTNAGFVMLQHCIVASLIWAHITYSFLLFLWWTWTFKVFLFILWALKRLALHLILKKFSKSYKKKKRMTSTLGCKNAEFCF